VNEAVETARVSLGRWLRGLLAWLHGLAAVVRRLVPEIRSARSSTTRTGERAAMPGSRHVSRGSSDRTVPIPTRIASLWARNRCTRVFVSSPVIATGLRPAAAILSSDETASLSIT